MVVGRKRLLARRLTRPATVRRPSEGQSYQELREIDPKSIMNGGQIDPKSVPGWERHMLLIADFYQVLYVFTRLVAHSEKVNELVLEKLTVLELRVSNPAGASCLQDTCVLTGGHMCPG